MERRTDTVAQENGFGDARDTALDHVPRGDVDCARGAGRDDVARYRGIPALWKHGHEVAGKSCEQAVHGCEATDGVDDRGSLGAVDQHRGQMHVVPFGCGGGSVGSHEATVAADLNAGHVPRQLAGQERDHRGELLGSAVTTDGDRRLRCAARLLQPGAASLGC